MIDPLDVMNNTRFDVTAKHMYLRFKYSCPNSNFGRNVYEHHLRQWNGLREGNPPKNNLNDFLRDFNLIDDHIKNGTFNWDKSPIPVNENSDVVNGSHRLAAAIFHNQKVKTVAGSAGEIFEYDHLKMYGKKLDQTYADEMAVEYCRLFKNKKNLYIVIVFPSAMGGDKKINDIIKSHSRLVYYKTANISRNGGKNLVRQLYLGEQWCGGMKDGFPGAKVKSDLCYNKDGQTRVYLIQTNDFNNTIIIKQKIRDIFKIQHNSVHINDDFESTWRIANILFNKNSIEFINKNNDNVLKMDKFQRLTSRFRKYLIDKNLIMSDDYCIDSSAVMSAHGIRDCADIDYMSKGDFPKNIDAELTNHNNYAKYYNVSMDDLVNNPNCYFYYNGLKFCTLFSVKAMKSKRGEDKDKKDVKLIENLKW